LIKNEIDDKMSNKYILFNKVKMSKLIYLKILFEFKLSFDQFEFQKSARTAKRAIEVSDIIELKVLKLSILL